MATERKVTVKVDLTATGNLGDVMKARAAEAQKLADSVKAGSGQAAIAPPAATAAAIAIPAQNLFQKIHGAVKEGAAKIDRAIDAIPVVGSIKRGIVKATGAVHDVAAKRYGPGTAKAIMASGVVADLALTAGTAAMGAPVIIPGMSLLGTIPAFAAAEAKYWIDKLRKKKATHAANVAKAKAAETTAQTQVAAEGATAQAAIGAGGDESEVQRMAAAAQARRGKRLLMTQQKTLGIDYGMQEDIAASSRAGVAKEMGTVGSEAHLKALREEVELEGESIELAKKKEAILNRVRLADLKTGTGQAGQIREVKAGYEARGAAAQVGGQEARVNRQAIGGPEHMAALKAETAARWESARNARMEARASNIAEYGAVGGNLVTFGQRINTTSANLAKGFAAMLATAAAAPALFQTLTGSMQLAVGELAIAFTPTIVMVSRALQGLADGIRWVNEATGGMAGKIIGATLVVGAIGFVVSKSIAFMAPAFSLMTRAMVAVTATGNAAAAALGKVAVTGGAASAAQAGGAMGGFSGGGGVKGLLGKLGIAASIAYVGSTVAQTAGQAVGGKTGSLISDVGTFAAYGGGIGAMFGPVGFVVGAAIGATVGLVKNLVGGKESSADKLAKFSMNFQGGAQAFEGMHEMIQREAIRDPMQQAKFDQEARAMEALALEIGGLKNAIAGINQSWQVGN